MRANGIRACRSMLHAIASSYWLRGFMAQCKELMIGTIDKRIIIAASAPERGEQAAQEHPTGIGVLGATAIVATVAGSQGLSIGSTGAGFAAWIGLVPREDSTGGKQKLGPISKQGDRYLRRILVVGACAVLKLARQKPEKYPWLTQLLARRPFKVVAVALPTRWRAWPGHCWPRAAPIIGRGRQRSNRRSGDGER